MTDNTLKQCPDSNEAGNPGVSEIFPERWFEVALQLYPGLTAPGVRLLRQSGLFDGATPAQELERAVLAGALRKKPGVRGISG